MLIEYLECQIWLFFAENKNLPPTRFEFTFTNFLAVVINNLYYLFSISFKKAVAMFTLKKFIIDTNFIAHNFLWFIIRFNAHNT